MLNVHERILAHSYSLLGHGEVYSGLSVAGAPLKLTRIPGIQNAKSVFTDFKASNFSYLQKVYRYEIVVLELIPKYENPEQKPRDLYTYPVVWLLISVRQDV